MSNSPKRKEKKKLNQRMIFQAEIKEEHVKVQQTLNKINRGIDENNNKKRISETNTICKVFFEGRFEFEDAEKMELQELF